jgi:hypothetical protein
VFSRTWLAVLAGSLVLWGINQIGAGPPSPAPDPGDVPPAPAPASPSAAADAVPVLAACLDAVVALDVAAPAGPGVREVLSVERRYRDHCRPVLDGAAFDAFAVAYGVRSRAVVAAILDREERLAAEVLGGPAAVLDPDVVWAAALARAASDARAFENELVAWFGARVPASGAAVPLVAPDDSVPLVSAGALAR